METIRVYSAPRAGVVSLPFNRLVEVPADEVTLDGDGRHTGLCIKPPFVHQLVNESDAPALNLIVIHPTRARTLHELNHNHVTWV